MTDTASSSPKTILRIDASARRAGSISRQLADKVMATLAAPGDRIVLRDLADGLPGLTETDLASRNPDAGTLTAEQRAALALSDKLVAELASADTVVISLPIYNFGVPAPLKAWIDQIARAGVTFRYTANGPVGLLQGKRAILVLASGGTTVNSPIDFATPYLRHVLGFVGINDVSIVAADALMVDAEASQARANDQIAALAA